MKPTANDINKEKQTVLTQKYMTVFHCIGSECENDCCHGWAIQVDKVFYGLLKRLSKQNFRERKRFKWIKKNPQGNEINFAQLQLKPNEPCPYINSGGLCDIHARFGHEKLGIPCKDYPRIILSDGKNIELSGSLSCPEIARQCLLVPSSYHLIETGSNILSGTSGHIGVRIKGDLDENPYTQHRHYLRNTMLKIVDLENDTSDEKLFVLVKYLGRLNSFMHNNCTSFPIERMRNIFDEIISPEHHSDIKKEFATIPDNSYFSISLIQALLVFRSDIESDFNHLLNQCWSNANTSWKDGSVDNIDQQTLDHLLEFYCKRRDKLALNYQDIIDSYFQRFMGYFFFRNAYYLHDNISKYLRTLIIQKNIIKFLFMTHPDLNALLGDSTHGNQTDILDKTIVDVAHRTARAFEHLNAEILDIMSTVLDEKGINTPDTIATLIKT